MMEGIPMPHILSFAIGDDEVPPEGWYWEYQTSTGVSKKTVETLFHLGYYHLEDMTKEERDQYKITRKELKRVPVSRRTRYDMPFAEVERDSRYTVKRYQYDPHKSRYSGDVV